MKKIDFKKYFENVKIKHAFLMIMACLLFAVGFANYHPDKLETKEFAVVENENEDMIGDVELVSSGSVVENDTISLESHNDDYFGNIRIERDSMYSKMLDTYNKMLSNDKLAETQKSIAIKEIETITNNQNAIMIAENLIRNKGFEDVVILANSDIINVIVKSAVLSDEDIVKIQNVIEREFGVSLENVNISNKN